MDEILSIVENFKVEYNTEIENFKTEHNNEIESLKEKISTLGTEISTLKPGNDKYPKITKNLNAITGKILNIPYSDFIPTRIRILLNGTTEVPLSNNNGYLCNITNSSINILCGTNSIGFIFDDSGKITELTHGIYNVQIF